MSDRDRAVKRPGGRDRQSLWWGLPPPTVLLDKLLEVAYDGSQTMGDPVRMLNGIARFPRIRRPEALPGIGSGAGRRVIGR